MRVLRLFDIIVHCRTGSLEKLTPLILHLSDVHCRTGSLEIYDYNSWIVRQVHCRTGSLETI
ncbi:hypothetical protein VOA_000784 [Vibrio sp. RC586]|nr:hypothetical protein VOA_000784 [Vibrio sp. RC586]